MEGGSQSEEGVKALDAALQRLDSAADKLDACLAAFKKAEGTAPKDEKSELTDLFEAAKGRVQTLGDEVRDVGNRVRVAKRAVREALLHPPPPKPPALRPPGSGKLDERENAVRQLEELVPAKKLELEAVEKALANAREELKREGPQAAASKPAGEGDVPPTQQT